MPYNNVIKLDGFFLLTSVQKCVLRRVSSLELSFLLTFVQKYVLRRVSSLEPSLSTVGHPEATSCVAPELRHRS